MDSVLDLYKTKLKEALNLVTDLNIDRRIEAVSYWNELAEQLQDIIQKSGLSTTNNGHELNVDNNYQQQQLDNISSSIVQTFDRTLHHTNEVAPIYSHNPIDCCSTSNMQQEQIHQEHDQEVQQSHLMIPIETINSNPTLQHDLNNVTPCTNINGQMGQDLESSFMIPRLEQSNRLEHLHHHINHHVDDVSTKGASDESYLTLSPIVQNCSNLKDYDVRKQSTISQHSSANLPIHHDTTNVNNNIMSINFTMPDSLSPTNETGPTNSTRHSNHMNQCSDITNNVNSLQSCDPFAEIKPFNMMNQVHQDINNDNSNCKVNINFNNEHTCQVCGKSGFSTKGNLKRHLRAHSGEKPFKCEYCDSCFTEKKSLKIHVRRHTGEKPYKCHICGKPFSQTGVLQSHMALHYNERKFDCNKCGKAFRQRSQLKLHLMRHDGVKRLECTTCRAKFLTKGDLERHCRIHTGERPYLCQICGKTFTRQQSLNEHLNRHTGRKPYDCKYCDKSFSEMSACYKHAKTHKKQDSGDQSEQLQQLVDEQGQILTN